MQIYKLLPNADLGPNDYLPTPTQAHNLNVDDDPHDGDATILSTNAAMTEAWGLDVSGIPDGSEILAVTIRSVQKQSTAGSNTYRVGFRVGDALFYLSPHTIGTGSAFLTFEDLFGPWPMDGTDWTKDRLATAALMHNQVSQAQGLPRPHLTECIVLVAAIPPISRPGASGGSLASRAAGSSLSGSAAAATTSPRAAATSRAPGGRGASRAPRSSGAPLAVTAAGASRANRAGTIVTPSGLRVTAQSLSVDVAGAGLAGSVTATVLQNETEGE